MYKSGTAVFEFFLSEGRQPLINTTVALKIQFKYTHKHKLLEVWWLHTKRATTQKWNL